MNRDESKRLDIIELDVKANTKQLEKIITNDLPHIKKDIAWIMGKISFLSPLTIGIAVGIVLLIIGVSWKIIFGG